MKEGTKDNKNERRDGVMRKARVEEKGKSEDEIRFDENSERVIKEWEEEELGIQREKENRRVVMGNLKVI